MRPKDNNIKRLLPVGAFEDLEDIELTEEEIAEVQRNAEELVRPYRPGRYNPNKAVGKRGYNPSKIIGSS